jgi:hypothetical protein
LTLYEFDITIRGFEWYDELAGILEPIGFQLQEATITCHDGTTRARYVNRHKPEVRIDGPYLKSDTVKEEISVSYVESFPGSTSLYFIRFGVSHSYDHSPLHGGGHGSGGCSGNDPVLARDYGCLETLRDDLFDTIQRGRWLACLKSKEDIVCNIIYGVDFSYLLSHRSECFLKGKPVGVS